LPVRSTLKKYLTPNAALWCCILLICVGLGLVYTSSRDALLRSAVEAEGHENELLAGIVMANTDAVFTQADAIARYVQTGWPTLDLEEVKRLAHSNRWGQGDVQHVEVADVSGRVVVSSRREGRRNLSIRDQRYFQIHLQSDRPAFFLSDLLPGNAPQKTWLLVLSRRLNHSDGRFAGVVTVTLEPETFTTNFGGLPLDKRVRISLAHVESGRILARSHLNFPQDSPQSSVFDVGGSLVGSPHFESANSSAKWAGHRSGASVTSGELSVYGWHKSKKFPLLTMLATNQEAGLVLYRKAEQQLRISLLFVVALILCMGLVVSRGSRLQKLALGKMRDARALAEQSDSFKNEFINAISHEVRGPLTNIKGFAELWVMQQPDHETSKDYALTILRAVDHVDRVVSQLLDAEKGSAGQLQLFPSAVDIRKLVSDCVHIHRAQAEKKGLVLSSHFSGDEQQILYIDGFRFAQILHNLLSNAVKFTGKGAVDVAAHLSATRLNVSVHDSGPGIPPQYRETIFERFRQGDPELSRIHGGTGLGLNLCQTLAVLMGGTISFETTVGAGTTFNVEIPYATSGAERSGAHAERRQAPPAVF
jgi:two-component system, NarL family, sensor histidine kinase BarA